MLKRIVDNLLNSANIAFVIDDVEYDYKQLAILVKNYYSCLTKNIRAEVVGIVMRNDLETYAFMTAVMLSETGYVILNPVNPRERNLQIAEAANLSIICSSHIDDKKMLSPEYEYFMLKEIPEAIDAFVYIEPNPDATAYILFTSGSTGNPKGVKLTKGNLIAFLDSFFKLPISYTENDHVLQMFDLTFDVSVAMLFLSLCQGATIYTTDPTKIKYLDIARILTTYPISIACMVPSVISLLKPYLPEIHLPQVKTFILTAEATTNSLLNLIKPSIPNADIWNLYGPTEATIWCLAYKADKNIENELYNDYISIGQAMPGVKSLIINDGNIITNTLEKGELYIGGKQVAAGYVNDIEKNNLVFHLMEFNGISERFYSTGDIVYLNEYGNVMYCGRKDHQVKIQGYRIELNEIEYYARKCTDTMAIAIAKEVDGNMQLFLFVENYAGTDESITDYLEQKLPVYMVPKRIYNLKQLPINSSNKIDRKKLEDTIPEHMIQRSK